MMKYSEVGGYGSVPTKKRGGLIVGILLFLVVLLVLGGLFYYKLVYSKNSIQVLLNGVFDYLDTSLEDNDYDHFTGNFSLEMKMQGEDSSDNELYNILNQVSLSGSYGIDYNQNIMSLDFYSDYGDEDLINMNVYTEYGKGYVYLEGLYDKYIESSINNYSDLFEKNTDDYKNILIGLKKAINGSLKDEYFTKEKVTIDSKKLTKTTLDLTGNNYQEYYKSFTSILLKDKNFLESFAKVTKQEVKEVEEELQSSLEEDDGEKIILYTDRFEFVKIDITSSDGRLVIIDDNGKYSYKLYDGEVEIVSGVVSIKTEDNENIILFSYYDNEELVGVEFTIKSSINKDGKVERKDVSNAVNYNNLSDDEIMSIYFKLMDNKGIVKIIEKIPSLYVNEDDENIPIITS